VWLIDGGSSDRTVEIARGFASSDTRVTVIAERGRLNLPEALNVGIGASSGEFVAKVDAHGYPERDFLSQAAAAFASAGSDVACVGGRPEQEGETEFGRALAIARGSRFGVGASGYAGRSARELVDTVQCGVYRRSALEAVGSFEPEMNFGEDEELNWRLRQAGFRILLDTRIRFHYFTRPTWRSAYRQYSNYGEARVNVASAHPGFLRPHHLAPGLLVGGVGILAAGAPFKRSARRALRLALDVYAAAAAGAAVRACGPQQRRLAPRTASAFVALHAGYGVGTLRGLWKKGRRSSSPG
jgi:succinoglycan biosynthesis protein ExoA